MNKEIPVLVHHELNAKPQTGGGKNQLYVKYCIEQAERYNKRVILLVMIVIENMQMNGMIQVIFLVKSGIVF